MRQITIMAMVDVASALADRSLAENLYFVDNQRAGGSTHEGTEVLRTRVRKGDELVWMTHSLQVETFVEMSSLALCRDHDAIEISKQYFRDTDIVIWVGKVKKHLEHPIPYKAVFQLGTVPVSLPTSRCPSLFAERRLLGEPPTIENPSEAEGSASTESTASKEPPAETEPSAEAKPPIAKTAKKPATGRTRKRKAP